MRYPCRSGASPTMASRFPVQAEIAADAAAGGGVSDRPPGRRGGIERDGNGHGVDDHVRAVPLRREAAPEQEAIAGRRHVGLLTEVRRDGQRRPDAGLRVEGRTDPCRRSRIRRSALGLDHDEPTTDPERPGVRAEIDGRLGKIGPTAPRPSIGSRSGENCGRSAEAFPGRNVGTAVGPLVERDCSGADQHHDDHPRHGESNHVPASTLVCTNSCHQPVRVRFGRIRHTPRELFERAVQVDGFIGSASRSARRGRRGVDGFAMWRCRLRRLFTVPSAQPSILAISASEHASKYRSTNTTRCSGDSSASARPRTSASSTCVVSEPLTDDRGRPGRSGAHHAIGDVATAVRAGPWSCVRTGGLVCLDPVPAPKRPPDRLLHQVLGPAPVARQQPRQVQQRAVRRRAQASKPGAPSRSRPSPGCLICSLGDPGMPIGSVSIRHRSEIWRVWRLSATKPPNSELEAVEWRSTGRAPARCQAPV